MDGKCGDARIIHSALKERPFSTDCFARFLLAVHRGPAAEAVIGLLNILPTHSSEEKHKPMLEEAGLPLSISKTHRGEETFLRHYEAGLWGIR